MLQVLAVMAMGRLASAIAFPAPDPTITAAPVAKRVVTTAGYHSTGFTSGSTLWGVVTYDLTGRTISTRGDEFRICATAKPCNFFTCSGDYMYASGSSEYCGTSIGSTCSSDVSYTDLADKSPLTNYWCDSMTLEGWAIYAETTGGGTLPASKSRTTSVLSSNPISPLSVSTTPTPFPTPSPSPTPNPIPEPKPKSTPVGAIVGGVVGGLAVLGLIAFGILFFLKKNKKNNNNGNAVPGAPGGPAPPPTFQSPPQPNYAQPVYYPPQPPSQPQSPPMSYNSNHNSMVGSFAPGHEKVPNATVNVNPYYVNTETGPTSPVPQYSANNGAVNELPAQRM